MFPPLGAPVGFIAANGFFLVLGVFLIDQQFREWGWRVPFLASSVLVALGLWVRLRLTETPAFQEAAAAEQRLAALRSDGQATEAQVAVQRAALEQATARIAEATRTAEEAAARQRALESAIQAAQTRAEQLNREAAAVEQRVAAQQQELARLQGEARSVPAQQ